MNINVAAVFQKPPIYGRSAEHGLGLVTSFSLPFFPPSAKRESTKGLAPGKPLVPA